MEELLHTPINSEQRGKETRAKETGVDRVLSTYFKPVLSGPHEHKSSGD